MNQGKKLRGKLARALRRITGFNPHEKREYRDTDKGAIVEITTNEDGKETMVTIRSIYRMSKKKYVREKWTI